MNDLNDFVDEIIKSLLYDKDLANFTYIKNQPQLTAVKNLV